VKGIFLARSSFSAMSSGSYSPSSSTITGAFRLQSHLESFHHHTLCSEHQTVCVLRPDTVQLHHHRHVEGHSSRLVTSSESRPSRKVCCVHCNTKGRCVLSETGDVPYLICSARVPRIRARSYFVMKRVVMRGWSDGTGGASSICAGKRCHSLPLSRHHLPDLASSARMSRLLDMHPPGDDRWVAMLKSAVLSFSQYCRRLAFVLKIQNSHLRSRRWAHRSAWRLHRRLVPPQTAQSQDETRKWHG